jgi:hypothetical protein
MHRTRQIRLNFYLWTVREGERAIRKNGEYQVNFVEHLSKSMSKSGGVSGHNVRGQMTGCA